MRERKGLSRNAAAFILRMRKEEKWILYTKKADFTGIAARYGVDQVTARIIVNRGVKEDEIDAYLNGGTESLSDPALLKDAVKAVSLLKEAIASRKKIAIASDYDNDGVFSGLLLKEALCGLGAAADIFTPDRVKEGYGLNERIVSEAFSGGYELLITCDNGIAAFEPIKRAKELGMTVIVTDHHEVPFQEREGKKQYLLPEADAIVDAWQEDCPYPFKGMCGTGVAFRLMELLYKTLGVEMKNREDFLQYTAIATVADVMELRGENRILVREGLKLLHRTEHTGLKALIEESGLERSSIGAYHIGFVLGPCFNAAGRLVTAEPAFMLLEEKNPEKARELAANLAGLNARRKEMTAAGVEQGIAVIEAADWKNDPVYVVYLENCHESVAGIIAGRIREYYYRPVLVFTDAAEEGLVKASGRSIEAYDMFSELNAFRSMFLHFGGHRMAAGLTMRKENLELLRAKLNEACRLSGEDLKERVMIDAPVPLSYLNETMIEDLKKLEPFGRGNEKPLFARQHFRVLRYSLIGKNRNVVKLKLTEDGRSVMDALFFGDAEAFHDFLVKEYGEQEVRAAMRGELSNIDIAAVYYPQINEFNGIRSLQIVIQSYCRFTGK